jgi:hypothetical protein
MVQAAPSQSPQVPPQSTAVSVAFWTPSVQVGPAQKPSSQTPDTQSVGTPHPPPT